MKELFSKVLNWVTITALVVWLFLNAIVFFFPNNVQFIFEMDEKLIWAIVGAVIGAGGMKAKLEAESTSQAKTEIESSNSQVDEAPMTDDFE